MKNKIIELNNTVDDSKPKTLRIYNKKTLLGYRNNEPIYFYAPTWDCGWYWGFGYLGNRNCHYHLSGLNNKINLRDALIEHFGTTLTIRPSDLWKFAELVNTVYALKNTAEVLGRGGSYISSNPLSELIKNPVEVSRINRTLLPALFDEIYKIFDRNKNNTELFKNLVEVDNKGLTSDTIKFMEENSITPDDLKIVEDKKDYAHEYIAGITGDDHSRIDSAYWKNYHANNKK